MKFSSRNICLVPFLVAQIFVSQTLALMLEPLQWAYHCHLCVGPLQELLCNAVHQGRELGELA